MTTMEDRLRADLPELADALMAAKPDPVAPPVPIVSVRGRDRPDPFADGAGTESSSHFELTASRGRRWVLAAAACVLGLAAVGGVVARWNRAADPTAIVAGGAATPSFGSWSPIADAPITPRPFAVTAWTGSEAAFWAGSSLSRGFAYTDGALYDPVSDTWSAMAVPGWGHPGLTGSYFDGQVYALAKGGGARFDPVAGTWTDLPTVDFMFLAATVAGDDAVWGLGPAGQNVTGQPDLAIVRYDPTADAWDELPRFEGTVEQAEIVAGIAALETKVLWSGSEIVAWGGVDGGLAFDPGPETWRALAPPISPDGVVVDSVAVATDDGLALLAIVDGRDGPTATVATLTDGGTWSWSDAQLPFTGLDGLTVVGAGDWLVVFSADEAPTTVDLRSGAWMRHDEGPLGAVEAPNAAWTGEALVVWGGVADAGSPTGAMWTPPSS